MKPMHNSVDRAGEALDVIGMRDFIDTPSGLKNYQRLLENYHEVTHVSLFFEVFRGNSIRF